MYVYIALAFIAGYLIGRYVRWSHRNDWKADAATDKQKDYAEELGIRIPRNCTKGELSALIDAALGKNKA